MRKTIKNIALIWMIILLASAVSNWGGEMLKNPVLVTIGLFVSTFVYALADIFGEGD